MMKTLSRKNTKIIRELLAVLLLVALVTQLVLVWPKKAEAFCCPPCITWCTCTLSEFIDTTTTLWNEFFNTTFNVFGMAQPIVYVKISPIIPGVLVVAGIPPDAELPEHQMWLYDVWFVGDYLNRTPVDGILPTLQLMTESLTAAMMSHTFIIGTFIDAKIQLETQSFLREKAMETHKMFHPSPGVCVFGTEARTLASTEERKRLTSYVLSQRLIDRQMGSRNSSGTEGSITDLRSRLDYFKNRVCDRMDNDRTLANAQTGFQVICTANPRTAGTVNRDIDFTRSLLAPRTLNVDFVTPTGPGAADNEYILGLASNLFAHSLFEPFEKENFSQYSNQNLYLDLRSVVAKRGVAQAPFNALVGLKARGTTESGTYTRPYMAMILQELSVSTTQPLGMSNATAERILGTQPSYYAQMEILAKKLYQRPGFYMDLYDKPANVKRKSLAMQAVGLMLDREIYDSYLRTEALMAQLLELRVIRKQEVVENDLATSMGPD